MNQKITIKSLFVAASLLGLSAVSRADDAKPATTPLGLLGQTYAGLSYSYVNLASSPVNADRYGFEYNQAINSGFDANFNYDGTQAGLLAGDRAQDHSLDATLRSFMTSVNWGKPYLEAGLGYDWTKVAGVNDHSLEWIVGGGVEFQATSALTVTPFIRWVYTDRYSDHNTVDYGVKANYWLTKQWGVMASMDRNDDKDMSFKLGVNARF